MDELTSLIKKCSKKKYNSTRVFSEVLGIPQTTIVSALKKGVSGTAFTTVVKMCNSLDIKLINGVYPAVIDQNAINLIRKISHLDEKGIYTVAAVVDAEYKRCNELGLDLDLPARDGIESITGAVEEQKEKKNIRVIQY